MMTKKEFAEEMKRMTAVFGDFYNQPRMDLIYDFVKTVSKKEFEKVVTHLLAISRFPPVPNDFRQAAFSEVDRRSGGFEMTKKTLGDIPSWSDPEMQKQKSPPKEFYDMINKIKKKSKELSEETDFEISKQNALKAMGEKI